MTLWVSQIAIMPYTPQSTYSKNGKLMLTFEWNLPRDKLHNTLIEVESDGLTGASVDRAVVLQLVYPTLLAIRDLTKVIRNPDCKTDLFYTHEH